MAFKYSLSVVILAFTLSNAAAVGNSTGFKPCDSLIAAGLEERLIFSHDAAYNATLESYYSYGVQELHPWCIVQPLNTEEVSRIVKTLGSESAAGNWDIAVKSGGHSFWPASNVARGVTIDLGLINTTVYNDCASSVNTTTGGSGYQNCTGGTVSVGSGARWQDVYAEVDKYGISVSGGRAGHVGVGGLLLGGGFSFHSAKRGLACDDVVNYEVVLGDGSIVNANASENPDLFKALKGGNNNLGIVTRFDLQSYPSIGFYGGVLALSYDSKDVVVNQFVNLVDNLESSPADSEFLSLSWGPAAGKSIAIIPTNDEGNANSSLFAPLNTLPALVDTRGQTTYGQLIQVFSGTNGLRNVWFTLTFDNTLDMVNKVAEIFENAAEELQGQVSDTAQLIFVLQPLPTLFASKNPGGNILGLDKSLKRNGILWQGEALLTEEADELLLDEKLAAITAEIEAYAKTSGQDTPYLYLNYAHPAQDPLSAYGEDNVAFLKQAAAKYDPTEFFQKRVTGGFKISRVS